MLHHQTETLSPGEEMMFQGWVATRLGEIHARCVLFLCESCTLCKQTQLQEEGKGGGRERGREGKGGGKEREREGEGRGEGEGKGG